MEIEITGQRAVLKSRATPLALQFSRAIEGRKAWLKDGGLSFDASQNNLKIAARMIPGIQIIHDSPLDTSVFDDAQLALRVYNLKGDPDLEGQTKCKVKAKAWLMNNVGFAIFSEQGTGKTKIAIDLAGWMWSEGIIDAVIVVAPKGVHIQWVAEALPKYYGAPYVAAHWPLKELPKSLRPGAVLKWLTINIDGIKSPAGWKACEELVTWHRGRVLMIWDESHQGKNDKSRRWEAANYIGQQCVKRICMTGTPYAKDLTDVWAQFKWMDESVIGIRYKTTFRAQFCETGGFQGREVIGPKDLQRFREIIDPASFRYTKAQMGLPPKLYNEWVFSINEKQREMIQRMKRQMIAEIDEALSGRGVFIMAKHGADKDLRLQQIGNGFLVEHERNKEGKITKSIHHRLFDNVLDNPRIAALLEWEASIDRKKIVCWVRFREDAAMIQEALGAENCVMYLGGLKPYEQKLAKASFLDPNGPKWFISTPSAGGTGLDGLQHVCEQAIYYSRDDNSILRWQSEDRTNRIGTKEPSYYTDLIGRGTTDRKQIARRKFKKSLAEMTLEEYKRELQEDDWESYAQ